MIGSSPSHRPDRPRARCIHAVVPGQTRPGVTIERLDTARAGDALKKGGL